MGQDVLRIFLRPVAELVDCDSVLINLPGHGGTDGELSFENYVSKLINFLKNCEFLKGKDIVLIGHSLGSCVILKTACEVNVAGIIPISGMAQNDVNMACLDENGQLDMNVLMNYADIITDGTPVELDSNPSIMIADINMGNHMNFLEELKNIYAPVLFMTGLEDKLVPTEKSYQAKEYLVNAHVVVNEYPGFKHFLPLANKKVVAEDINKFIANL